MTGTRPLAIWTVWATTSRCSSRLKVALSPVVPHGTSALEPSPICHSTKSANVSSATRPPENGVTSAGIEPKNMNLPPERRVREMAWGRRSRPDKERDRRMSSMWRLAVTLPVLLAIASSSSAQYAVPGTYAARPAYAPSVASSIDQWRMLRQTSGYRFSDYASFVIANPDWPDVPRMRGWAEKAMQPG